MAQTWPRQQCCRNRQRSAKERIWTLHKTTPLKCTVRPFQHGYITHIWRPCQFWVFPVRDDVPRRFFPTVSLGRAGAGTGTNRKTNVACTEPMGRLDPMSCFASHEKRACLSDMGDACFSVGSVCPSTDLKGCALRGHYLIQDNTIISWAPLLAARAMMQGTAIRLVSMVQRWARKDG